MVTLILRHLTTEEATGSNRTSWLADGPYLGGLGRSVSIKWRTAPHQLWLWPCLLTRSILAGSAVNRYCTFTLHGDYCLPK